MSTFLEPKPSSKLREDPRAGFNWTDPTPCVVGATALPPDINILPDDVEEDDIPPILIAPPVSPLPDSIIILQPTSPLRISSDIDNALRLFKQGKLKSLVSVHKVSEHPYECVKSGYENWTYLEYPKQDVFRRQDYEQNFFFINGAIYLLRTDFFLENNTFVDKGRSFLFEMPKERGVDIDTPLDLEIAKSIFLSNHIN